MFGWQLSLGIILLGSTCHRVKKCGKIPLGIAKCGNQFASHTFYSLPHLPKVSCVKLWLTTKHTQSPRRLCSLQHTTASRQAPTMVVVVSPGPVARPGMASVVGIMAWSRRSLDSPGQPEAMVLKRLLCSATQHHHHQHKQHQAVSGTNRPDSRGTGGPSGPSSDPTSTASRLAELGTHKFFTHARECLNYTV